MNMYDALTDLYNREGFFEKVQEVLDREEQRRYQIILLNVRHFKLINDLFGMRAGDKLLIKISNVLKEHILPEGIGGRLEADNFSIFIPEQYSEEMLDFLTNVKLYIDESKSYQIHIDIGCYEIGDATLPVSIMCDRARMALYTIKDNHLKKFAYYHESMREHALKEQVLYGEIQRALGQGEIKLYLQGIYDQNCKLLGAEALVRWDHPARGILPAGDFIEILEQNGMIVKVDQYVWECACRQLQKWKKEGHEELFLSVNISTKDFEAIDVCREFEQLTHKYDISPRMLRLEITETALMQNIEKNLEVIEKLRSMGFVVEIDDFGSGYSSLNMLKDIVVDVIKLDMKFLHKCKDEERSKTILRMVIGLIKELRMKIIVEGVETQEQFGFLKTHACDAFQGYFFMRPMAVENFEKEL